jgi:hypothetical protein
MAVLPEEPPALLSEQPPEGPGWSEALDALSQIRELEDDWDGLGAPAPSMTLVDSAVHLAQVLRAYRWPPPCRVVAGLTGTILFEWQGAGGNYFEVEVTRPQHAEWVSIVPGQQTTSGEFGW